MSTLKEREIELAWELHHRWTRHLDGRPGLWRTRKERHRMAEAQNWRCPCCGTVMDPDGPKATQPTFEHLVPRAFGGADHPDNVLITCHACNSGKVAEAMWEAETEGDLQPIGLVIGRIVQRVEERAGATR